MTKVGGASPPAAIADEVKKKSLAVKLWLPVVIVLVLAVVLVLVLK